MSDGQPARAAKHTPCATAVCNARSWRRSGARVAGAVGVSAGTVEEDHQVADTGRRAFRPS